MRSAALVSALPGEDEQLANLLRGKGYKAWRSKVEAVGGCAKPVRLAGSSAWVATDGVPVREVSGSILAACNNRRETVCPACSARYGSDTFHLVRAGLSGGKGVPADVTGRVRVFATLTAPSFGPVHNRPTTASGKARPCGCGERHHQHDPRLGTPLDPTTYDYVGAVLWQAHAPELWRRFTMACARYLAGVLGVPKTRLREYLRLSFAKVAEYQRRGLIHFHAVIRADGPAGPGSPAPEVITAEVLCEAVRVAAARVWVNSPDSAAVGVHRLVFGGQVDVEPIQPGDSGDPGQLAHERKVAAYIAKYAVKGTGATAGPDSPIRNEDQISQLDVTAHAKAMIATAWRLGGLPEFGELRLRKWAHMLGFRGHFLTKSRHYSTTFTALRTARGQHRMGRELAALGIADTTGIEVVNHWAMTGVGYRSAPERELAAAIADTAAHRRTQRRHQGDQA